MLFTKLAPPQWMSVLEPPLLSYSVVVSTLEIWVQFPVAAPGDEKLFKQYPMAEVCEPSTCLPKFWLIAEQARV